MKLRVICETEEHRDSIYNDARIRLPEAKIETTTSLVGTKTIYDVTFYVASVNGWYSGFTWWANGTHADVHNHKYMGYWLD